MIEGTVAITDFGWYEFLSRLDNLDEVNFWTPSSYWSFKAEINSPFFFKLKAKYKNAICGFGIFTRYSKLPDWLAWDSFQIRNGCPTLETMRDRIGRIRERIDYQGSKSKNEIGCILIAQPVFFSEKEWIKGPQDWPSANLRPKKYNLSEGEGKRIWEECLNRIPSESIKEKSTGVFAISDVSIRYGIPQLIQPRLGQGIFRVSVIEAYSRACAITHEHSLPALEASHIKPFSKNGPHEVSNGILLRADLHRLFDQGYITITTDHKLEVSRYLKQDFENGKTYYPLHGQQISLPSSISDRPNDNFLSWHNENIYRK
jgi:putative restriction endonuclease